MLEPGPYGYVNTSGICKEMSFTRKWQGKIPKLKEIARISLYQLQV